MALTLFLLLIGLVVLIAGAEALVRGASSLAKTFGISPLVIGLTVVAFGTSAPELIVNILAAARGTADIAIGNVVGSNIVNILLILGISAAISPLKVGKTTVWKEIPFALLAMVLVFTMGNDALFDGTPANAITRTDGFSLISLFVIFLFYTYGISREKGHAKAPSVRSYPTGQSLMFTIGGLVFLFFGGKMLVDNAVTLARVAGISEALIGLTIVAVGTSLPELATSVIAAIHHQDDIAVGNIIGSNIFNVFWILGFTGTLLQLPFTPSTNSDVLVAVAATFLLFFAMFTGKRHALDRWQGISFILLYFLYIAYLIGRG